MPHSSALKYVPAIAVTVGKHEYQVGNNGSSKAKGQLSKCWLQENKVLQVFRKTSVSYLLIRHLRVRNVVKNVNISENLVSFVFS